MYADFEGANVCLPCTKDYYCPSIAMKTPQVCPMGYLCDSESRFSKANIKECPAGYYCPSGTTNMDI